METATDPHGRDQGQRLTGAPQLGADIVGHQFEIEMGVGVLPEVVLDVQLAALEFGISLGELQNGQAFDLFARDGLKDEIVELVEEQGQLAVEGSATAPNRNVEAQAAFDAEVRVADLIRLGGRVRTVGIELRDVRRFL